MSNIIVVQSFKNLHSSRKLKNKQVAKIWSLYLKKQKFGTTVHFPDGLEDSPFRHTGRLAYASKHVRCYWLETLIKHENQNNKK